MLQNRGAMYYYITNLQGDVIRLVNSSGQTAAYYEYDPYGNAITAAGSHCEINPLRYRGYVYDTETGLYYCQSRYYDPAIGRFINADEYSSTGQGIIGNNMFAYCGNNPINREDRSGDFWLFTAAAKVSVGLATQYAGDVIGNIISGKTGFAIFERTSTNGEYLAAGITALIPGSGFGGAVVRNIVSETINMFEDAYSGENISVGKSIARVAAGTVLDMGFEKLSDQVSGVIRDNGPRNYSSYAQKVRQKKPGLSSKQIYKSMQRSIRTRRAAAKVASLIIDSTRASLP